MEMKGSRTQQNLLAAFTGESVARNKYLFYAEKAQQEGREDIQQLFEEMARNEGAHGKLLFQQLDGVGSSTANLQDAIRGEYGEWSSMYPRFAQVAREEGFLQIAALFDSLARIERDHEYRFLLAMTKSAPSTKAPAESPAEDMPLRSVRVQGFRCQFCGATFEQRPDVCSVCGAIGSFEPATFQKQL